MHDPNYLASFAARAPYHAEALLQLGMVFAHTGQASAQAPFDKRGNPRTTVLCIDVHTHVGKRERKPT